MTIGSNSSGHFFDTSLNADGVLYANGSGVVTSTTVGTATYVLTSNGAGNAPTFQASSASGAITTITGNSGGAEVPLAGNFNILGTGSITVAGSANTETVQLTGLTNHALQVGAGTATLTQLGAGTTGQVLQTNTAADPTWSTATYPSTTTINQLLYSSSANTVAGLATANRAVLTTGTTGIPALTALATDGQVIIGSTAGAPAAATLTAGTGITITNASNSISIATNSAAGIQTITGNSGGAESPSAGNFNVLGTGSITVAGSANTETVQLTGLTNHNILVGAGTATITNVAPSATSGIPLISQGASSDPAFGTAVVAGGGTGNTTFTAYSVIAAGTTATGAFQNVSGVGTSGQVLTSNGASALPTWQAVAAGSITINGDSGSLTGSTVTIKAGNSTQNCGSSVLFSNSGTTSTLNVTDGTTHNTIIGAGSGNASITGNLNTGVGGSCMPALTSGVSNTAIGYGSLTSILGGSNNTAIGEDALDQITTGNANIGLGLQAGINYTSSESSNIMIGNTGTLSESNVIRIGTQGSGTAQQNKCFIAGIEGVSVSNLNIVTINTSTGQLGSQAAANVGTVTQYDVLVGGTSGAIASVGPGSSGQVLQSGGNAANPAYSTATYPATATTSQQLLVANGTNWVGKAFSTVIQTFTSTGTYTPTSGMVYCIIECLGGGGAGGGAAATGGATVSTGGGGGAGEYARGTSSAATIGVSQAVTIGAAGTANSGAAGGNGGNTSVGAIISANGGTGGDTPAASISTIAYGGAGGTGGSGGSFRTPGSSGYSLTASTSFNQAGGNGANSQYGAGGASSAANAAGNAGLGYGSGGSGGYNYTSQSARLGGAGTKGIVIVTEYVIA